MSGSGLDEKWIDVSKGKKVTRVWESRCDLGDSPRRRQGGRGSRYGDTWNRVLWLLRVSTGEENSENDRDCRHEDGRNEPYCYSVIRPRHCSERFARTVGFRGGLGVRLRVSGSNGRIRWTSRVTRTWIRQLGAAPRTEREVSRIFRGAGWATSHRCQPVPSPLRRLKMLSFMECPPVPSLKSRPYRAARSSLPGGSGFQLACSADQKTSRSQISVSPALLSCAGPSRFPMTGFHQPSVGRLLATRRPATTAAGYFSPVASIT